MIRKCTKCQEKKPIELFYKDSSKPHGYGYSCKACGLKIANERYNKLEKTERLSYYYKNKEKVRAYQKVYELKTKKERREYFRKWETERIKNDPCYRIRKYLGNRIRDALKTNNIKKSKSIIELCGAGLDVVRTHLESQFKPGMSWENHGKWHIDHIKPVSLFNLLDPNEVKKCCHYTNLQPLWAFENLSKGAKH
jgi:hypothetical protein